MNRTAGILLPISALPGKYGIGSFSEEAYRFVDFLAESGQSYWQILPMNPSDHLTACDNPYLSFSAFAGNPYFIDLDFLKEKGLLTEEEIEKTSFGRNAGFVDYNKLYKNRFPLLRKAYDRADKVNDAAFQKFLSDHAWWLDDYALFMALKGFFGNQEWRKWPEDIRRRRSHALDHYHRELYFDIEFHKYLQYLFFTQWFALKAYANAKHIQIIGDIAIYVALDSADVWAHPELFQLDDNLEQIAVAGSPPDDFCEDGQVWGSPLYAWDVHRKDHYGWWMARLWHNFLQCDMLRFDHFRGLDEYFSIPYGSKTAQEGHWEPGPGMELFHQMRCNMGVKPIIAEDLGTQTDSVRRLVQESGFPNMKVLQFGFNPNDIGAAGDYLPHNISKHCVVYTGTHDNDTIHGWYMSLSDAEKKMVRSYYRADYTPDEEMWKLLIASALMSHGEICILPLQDYLGLGSEARMNTPGQPKGNYQWRVHKKSLSKALSAEIRDLTRRYGRLNWDAVRAADGSGCPENVPCGSTCVFREDII